MHKEYRLSKDQIKPLAEGYGLCVVSDLITVEGQAVGYAYREEPEDDADSGWRFLAGNESDAYIDNTKNFSVLDVNVIANYDDGIIDLLDEPVGAEFDRGEDGMFLDANE